MHASGSRQPSVVNAARDEPSPHQLVNALTLAPCVPFSKRPGAAHPINAQRVVE